MRYIPLLLAICILIIGIICFWVYHSNQINELHKIIQQKEKSVGQLENNLGNLNEQIKELQQRNITEQRNKNIDIESFVNGSNLSEKHISFVNGSNLPEKQEIEIILNDTSHEIKLFKVKYGEGHDCPAGCIYSTALGIQNHDKLGWISIDDYGNLNISNLHFYNFDENDSYLYSEDFLDRFRSVNKIGFEKYLLLIAKNPNTPRENLLEILNNNYTYVSYFQLIKALLQNTKVRSDKEILTLIVNLPNDNGNYLKDLKTEAQSLIAKLN